MLSVSFLARAWLARGNNDGSAVPEQLGDGLHAVVDAGDGLFHLYCGPGQHAGVADHSRNELSGGHMHHRAGFDQDILCIALIIDLGPRLELRLRETLDAGYPEVIDAINRTSKLEEETEGVLKTALSALLKEFGNRE